MASLPNTSICCGDPSSDDHEQNRASQLCDQGNCNNNSSSPESGDAETDSYPRIVSRDAENRYTNKKLEQEQGACDPTTTEKKRGKQRNKPNVVNRSASHGSGSGATASTGTVIYCGGDVDDGELNESQEAKRDVSVHLRHEISNDVNKTKVLVSGEGIETKKTTITASAKKVDQLVKAAEQVAYPTTPEDVKSLDATNANSPQDSAAQCIESAERNATPRSFVSQGAVLVTDGTIEDRGDAEHSQKDVEHQDNVINDSNLMTSGAQDSEDTEAPSASALLDEKDGKCNRNVNTASYETPRDGREMSEDSESVVKEVVAVPVIELESGVETDEISEGDDGADIYKNETIAERDRPGYQEAAASVAKDLDSDSWTPVLKGKDRDERGAGGVDVANLQSRMCDVVRQNSNLKAENRHLVKKCEVARKENVRLERLVAELQSQRERIMSIAGVDPCKSANSPNLTVGQKRDVSETSNDNETEAKRRKSVCGSPSDYEQTPAVPIRKHMDIWKAKMNDLKTFKRIHGHVRVPLNYPNNPSLGKWVSRQREYYAYMKRGNMKKCHLTSERVNELDELGFVWKVGKSRSEIAKGRAALMEQKDALLARGECKEGESQSTTGSEEAENLLSPDGVVGRGKTPTPTAKSDASRCPRIPTKDRERWNLRYEELCQYKETYGDCLVPHHYPLNRPLGKWVSRQRGNYKSYVALGEAKSSLKDDQVELLNKIGFMWKVEPGHPRSM